MYYLCCSCFSLIHFLIDLCIHSFIYASVNPVAAPLYMVTRRPRIIQVKSWLGVLAVREPGSEFGGPMEIDGHRIAHGSMTPSASNIIPLVFPSSLYLFIQYSFN